MWPGGLARYTAPVDNTTVARGERCAATGRWVRVDPWDTGFVDLAGNQGLLGQREGRTGAAVVSWLAERTAQFREGIEYVAIDPAAVANWICASPSFRIRLRFVA